MNISEKAAYIKGLMEGMNYDTNSNEGKLFKAIANLLEDLSLSILDLEDEQALTNEYLEELDMDLGELEADFYECDDDDDDCDCCDCDCDCDDCDCDDDCDCCDCDCDCGDDDDCCDFFETECPHCGEKLYVDNALDGEEIDCPSCNKKFTE